MSTHKIVIPGNTPSLKNSKRIVSNGSHPRLISSKAHQDWKQQALWEIKTSRLVGKPWHYPVRVSFHFIRRTRQRFDYVNCCQAPMDILVEAGILEDDDMNHVIPGSFSWQVQKDAPCVIITIEEI